MIQLKEKLSDEEMIMSDLFLEKDDEIFNDFNVDSYLFDDIDPLYKDEKSREPLSKELVKCFTYELREIDKVVFGFWESEASELREFGELCIKIKAAIEFCLLNNPTSAEVKKHIDDNFSYPSTHLVSDFIEQTIDIAAGKIYSSAYFDKYFCSRYESDRTKCFFRDLLKSVFYDFHHNEYNTSPTWDSLIKHHERLDFTELRNIHTNYDRDSLYHKIDSVFHTVSDELVNLAEHINNEIKSLEIADIYELLSHKHENSYNNFGYYTRPDEIRKLTDVSEIKKMFKEFIETRAKLELCNRVESACRNHMSYDIYMDLLSMPPGFNTDSQDVSTTRMILWAWNYILLHKPDDLDITDKTEEQYAFVHMVDVLPGLEEHYRKRYSSFDKRYNKPNRKRFYTDQTEIYNKNASIPSKDFFVGKAPSVIE